MHPEIPIEEPFTKSWKEPQIFITREDIIDYENSQKQNCTQQRETINARQSELQSIASTWNSEHNDDCRESTEVLQKRLMDLRNSLLQSQIVKQQLHKQNKQCDNTHDSCLVFRSDVSLTNSQDCDWNNQMIPEHSISRSLPSSPLIGEIPNMTSSPTIPTTPERQFNFLPERLRLLEESRQLSESDEPDNDFRLSPGYCSSPQGKFVNNLQSYFQYVYMSLQRCT